MSRSHLLSAATTARARLTRAALGLVVATLVATGLVVTGTGGSVPTQAAMVTALRGAPDSYTPHTGVIFNDPLDNETRRVIRRHLMRTINSTPRGQTIRVASWNIASNGLVDALIRAHRRGVGVRAVMSRGVASRQAADSYFGRLRRALASGNADRPAALKSFARSCRGSCRGGGGIAHTKMYLFSRAGRANDVVMVSSANFTDAAAANQWNDLYTVVGRADLARKFEQIFTQMTRDRRATPPYQTKNSGPYQAWFLPYAGPRATGDPILKELGRMRCVGATGRTGYNGHTVIRIAQTAIVGDRGLRIANRLRRMHNRGCDIKIIYAVVGNQVKSVLEGQGGASRVPNRQFVQDATGDGVYDNYLHAKVMSVSGVYAGDSSARVVWNGTQNWSPKALRSDEAGFRIVRGWAQRTYTRWINGLYRNPPQDVVRTTSTSSARVTADGRVLAERTLPSGETVNPYAHIQVN